MATLLAIVCLLGYLICEHNKVSCTVDRVLTDAATVSNSLVNFKGKPSNLAELCTHLVTLSSQLDAVTLIAEKEALAPIAKSLAESLTETSLLPDGTSNANISAVIENRRRNFSEKLKLNLESLINIIARLQVTFHQRQAYLYSAVALCSSGLFFALLATAGFASKSAATVQRSTNDSLAVANEFSSTDGLPDHRRVIEQMPIGLMLIDQNLNIQFSNSALQKMTGYDDDELRQIKLGELLQGKEGESFSNGGRDLFERSFNSSLEVKLRNKDGALLICQFSIRWLQAETGKFLLANLLDTTAQSELTDLKRELTAIVSHDLRTPLSSLQIICDLLATDHYASLTPAGSTAVGFLKTEIARLARLVTDLLDFNKWQSNTIILDLKPHDASELVAGCVSIMGGLARKAGVEITTDACEEMIVCDADRIAQVLVNLLANAIKYAGRNGKVEVSGVKIDGAVRFGVKDTGPGIPVAECERVFNRYYQIPGGQSQSGSVGLGLSICKSIVEAHNGHIGVESEVGNGSEFWFEIPRRQATNELKPDDCAKKPV